MEVSDKEKRVSNKINCIGKIIVLNPQTGWIPEVKMNHSKLKINETTIFSYYVFRFRGDFTWAVLAVIGNAKDGYYRKESKYKLAE